MKNEALLQRIQSHIDEFLAQETHQSKVLLHELEEQHPADIAQILEFLEFEQLLQLFVLLEETLRVTVFWYFDSLLQAHLLIELAEGDKKRILQHGHADDISDLFAHLSDQELAKALDVLHRRDRKRILELSKFSPESAGGIMTIDIVSLLHDFTIAKSVELLQRLKPNKDLHPIMYVVDANNVLLGYVSLRDLVLHEPKTRLTSILKEVPYIASPHDDQESVAQQMIHYHLSTAPVVSEQGKLLGAIASDTVVDVVQKEAIEDVQKMSGSPVTESSYFTVPLWKLLYKRGAILTILMIAESVTSIIVHRYEAVLSTFLMGFFAMLVSTGGNTSGQTSAIVIQGMSSGDINESNVKKFLKREVGLGLLLGALLGLVAFARIYFLSGDMQGTVIVSSSVAVIVLLSVVLGSGVPLLLRKVRIDPAFSAGPFLATLMDILGIFIYCYIASLFLR